MRYARALLTAAIAAAAHVGCDGSDTTGPSQTAEAFDWKGTIAQGQSIEIKNIAGDVQASFAPGSEVVVHANKTGQDSDPASVTIEVVQHAGGVTICAVYPDVPGQAPNECAPGLQGNMSTQDNDVRVDFTLSVPDGVQFVGRAIAGDVEAKGLRSDAFVVTTGGDIDVSTTGIAEAFSVSGSLSIVIGQADPGRDLTFRSIAGDVSVRVPANTNAEAHLSTSGGTITSDFPLQGTTTTHRVCTLGNGGPDLRLSTVSGNVSLRAGAATQP